MNTETQELLSEIEKKINIIIVENIQITRANEELRKERDQLMNVI